MFINLTVHNFLLHLLENECSQQHTRDNVDQAKYQVLHMRIEAIQSSIQGYIMHSQIERPLFKLPYNVARSFGIAYLFTGDILLH